MKDAFDFIVEHAETIRAVLRSYINELPLAAVLLLAVSSYFFNWHLKIGWFKVRFEELQQLNQGKALHYSASLRRTLAIIKGTTDQTPSTILLVRERVFGWFGDGIWTARSLLKAVAVGTAFPFMIIALVWAATGNGQIRGLNMLPDWSAQPFWLRLCVLYVALLQFPLAIRLRRTSFETWTFVCQIGWKVLAGLVCTYGAIRFLFSDYFYFRGSPDFFALATLDLSVSLLNLVLLSVAGTMGARFFLLRIT